MNEIKFNSDDLAKRDKDDVIASNSLQEVVEDSKDALFGYDGVSLVGFQRKISLTWTYTSF